MSVTWYLVDIKDSKDRTRLKNNIYVKALEEALKFFEYKLEKEIRRWM